MIAEAFVFVAVALAFFVVGTALLAVKLYRKVEQGKALIISGLRDVNVTFTGGFVWPVIERAELMDISVKTMEIDRTSSEGLICRDNIRADIKVTFFVKVSKTKEDVIRVAQAIGCARASDQRTLEELFAAKFSEALKTVGKHFDFVDLYTKRNEFRDEIIKVIGTDLNGYSLEDAAIDYLEQTPIGKLDQLNILDAQGIRKITELTAVEHVRTNEFRRTEEKEIKRQDVEAAEAILELDRQKADAEAKQRREIESVKAREEAETKKIQAEERLRSETARIKSDEDVAIQEENMMRQVEVAQKNRERVIAVETERVEKDRLLEVIGREREVELQRIDKDKALEVEKRAIADVVRQRVAVDRTVAEEEEAIKRLRVVEEANRTKEATIITAEAEAQEALVKDIKAAEAAEQASTFKARERLTLANAELEAADREAKAKIRLAEATKAQAAAAGLAAAQVKEADAIATEKHGLAEAVVLRERGLAEGIATRERGAGEGAAMQARLEGEAAGLTEKAAAMKALDDASRQHEEYRLRLELDKEIELARIAAQQDIARAQAELVGKGLENADIDIVGGESIFFDRLVGAMAMGKALDGFVDKSTTAKKLLGDYLEGNGSLASDVKSLIANMDAGDVRDLTLAALLGKLMTTSDPERQGQVGKLLATAKKLGVDQVKLGPGSEPAGTA